MVLGSFNVTVRPDGGDDAVVIDIERSSWRFLTPGWVEVCVDSPRKFKPLVDVRVAAHLVDKYSTLSSLASDVMEATMSRGHVEDVSGEAPMGSCSLLFHVAVR